ncbi:MAG TPA: bifunctional DNA primase/polymerase [Leptospiraceae bacterium]|nr:bifunctional DNA primase/polymerase [Leptospiraceae bacterium]
MKHPETLREAAIHYNDWNLSIIPLQAGSKTPAGMKWKHYQYEHISRKTIEYTWNGMNDPNIGILGGSISGNLAIIDIDTYKAEKELMQDSIFREIREDSFVSKSAFKHLPHIAVRMQNAVRTGKALNGQIDIKSEGGYVVAPLSTLKDKNQLLMPYTWENFAEPLKLNPEQNEYVMKRFGLELIPEEMYHCYGLTYNEWIYVTTGNYNLIGKEDRSNADAKIIYKQIMYGRTKEQIRDFTVRYFWNGSKFKTYKKGIGFNEYFELTYRKCLEYADKQTKKNHELINKYRELIYLVSNNTDQKVLSVLLDVASWTKKGWNDEAFFMSVRTLAEKSGIAAMTASKSLKRLIEKEGIIIKEKEGTRFHKSFDDFAEKKPLAAVYRLNPIIPANLENLEKAGSFNPENINHDAFRFRGLGAKGKVIYETLLSLEGATRAELFREVKKRGVKSLNTLKSKLQKMLKFGLIEFDFEKIKFYAVQNPALLEEAAEILGTSGTIEKQKKKHHIQREGFQLWIKTPR